ncbi:N-acetylglucosamine-6-phosphate deacetylase [Novosphingobium sediminicola]|uniref:N-acetylglucosamine-6-phosphate deacetylase n=1 Tax=Novosphingobium sediminicola TaxID=563162 RepID=A0A7W6G6L9_9SPHN|nr:N-acetylglucosamine-6-phosphate deacetylase [Novosphingobium sediminicola]MBB3954102.1 N-acetylglucosamine-6-phosphate deacetylase [Novosphingobium sediminicola]
MNTVDVLNGQALIAGQWRSSVRLTMDGGRIVSVDDAGDIGGGADAVIDLRGGYLLPGFVDTQVNGGGGVLFNDCPTADGVAAIAAAHARFGTTALLPTLISDSVEAVAAALDAVDDAIAQGVPGIVGVHIEGPFINPARKGIHSEARLRRLDDAAMALLTRPRKGVVMLTIAPELAAPEQIVALARAGVIISAGHTDATYEEAIAGFDHGVRGVTHLYNAMTPLQHRAPGMVGAAFDRDDVYCGLIVDGVHVATPAVRLACRVKGPERLMLVTDAMPGVGNGGQPFMLDGRPIYVRDGMCTDEAGTLAGSGLDMATALRNTLTMTGLPMNDVSQMASATPAAFIGLEGRIGRIASGMAADFVALNADLGVAQTWIGGTCRFAG